jgi:N-acetylglucosamine-6-phosphate deacetylase
MMASLIPAKSVGIDDKCGRIKPGLQLISSYLKITLTYQPLI